MIPFRVGIDDPAAPAKVNLSIEISKKVSFPRATVAVNRGGK